MRIRSASALKVFRLFLPIGWGEGRGGGLPVRVENFQHSTFNIPHPKQAGRGKPHPTTRHDSAFSLLEVMIAFTIFFAASFAILALISSGLRTARLLKNTRPNAGMLAAELVTTNKLEEGTESGEFGKMYPGYSWSRESYEAGTNGLWQVDFAVTRRGQHEPESKMSILIFSPQSQGKRLGLQR